jgi:hypothetical protein
VEKRAKRQPLRDTDTVISESWPSKEQDATLKNVKCEAEESEHDWEGSDATMELPVISPLRAYGTSVFILDTSDVSDSEEGQEQEEEEEEEEEDNMFGSDGSASIKSNHGGAQYSGMEGRRVGIDGRKYSSREVYDSSDEEEEEGVSGCSEGKSSGYGDDSSDSEIEEASCDSLVRAQKLKVYGDDSPQDYINSNDIESDRLDDSLWSRRGGSASEQRDDLSYKDDLGLFRSRDLDDSEDRHSIATHSEIISERDDTITDGRDHSRRGSDIGSERTDTPHVYSPAEEDGHSAAYEEDQGEEGLFSCREGYSTLLKVEECERTTDWDGAQATDRSSGRFTELSDVTYGEESVLALAATAAAVAASRAAESEVQGAEVSVISRGDEVNSFSEGRGINEMEGSPDRPVCASLAGDSTEETPEDVSLFCNRSSAPSPSAGSVQNVALDVPSAPSIQEIEGEDSKMTEVIDDKATEDDGEKLGTGDDSLVVGADIALLIDSHSTSIVSAPFLSPVSAVHSPYTVECPTGEPSIELSSGDVRCKDWIEKVIRANIERRFSDPYLMGDEPVEAEDEPVETEDQPMETEDEPVETEDEPVETEDEPVEAEDGPVEAEDEPVETEDQPVETEDGPVETEDGPVETEDEPVETEDQPVETEDGPVETEDEPMETEDEPVETEDGPVETEDEPVETEDEPVEAEDQPVETEEYTEVEVEAPTVEVEDGEDEGEGVSRTDVVEASSAVSGTLNVHVNPLAALGEEGGSAAVQEIVLSNAHQSAVSPAASCTVDATMLRHDDNVSTGGAVTANIEASLWTGSFTEVEEEAFHVQHIRPTAHAINDSMSCPSSSGKGGEELLELHSESAGDQGSEFLEIIEVVEVADLPTNRDALPEKDYLTDESKGLRIIIEDTGYRIGNMGCLNPPSASFNPSSCSSKFQSPSSSSKILASYSEDLSPSFVKGRVTGLVLEIDPAEDADDIVGAPCADRRLSECQELPYEAHETPPPPPPIELSESPTALYNRDNSVGAFRRSEKRNKVEQSASTMPSSSCDERTVSPGQSMVRRTGDPCSYLSYLLRHIEY